MTPTREQNQAMSCVGKIKHRSRAAAIIARDAMLRRPGTRHKVQREALRKIVLEAYSCSHCGWFHLGHRAK